MARRTTSGSNPAGRGRKPAAKTTSKAVQNKGADANAAAETAQALGDAPDAQESQTKATVDSTAEDAPATPDAADRGETLSAEGGSAPQVDTPIPDSAETTAADSASDSTESAEKTDDLAEDAPAQSDAQPADAAPTDPPRPADGTAPPPPPAKSGPGFFPLVLGGLLAGGIGYGVNEYLSQSAPTDGPDMAALQSQITQLQDQLAQLPEASGLNTDAIDAEIAALRDEVESLRAQLAQAPTDPDAPADLDSSGLDERLEALAADLRDQASRASSDSAEAVTTVGAVADRMEALEAEMRDLRELAETRVADAEAAVDIALAQSGLDSFRAALETGAPYGDAITRLQDAGITPPEAIVASAGGVSTIEALQDSFPDAARAALRDSLQAAPAENVYDRMANFLRAQTGARSTVARDGDDLDAILSRVGVAVEDGDIAGALAQLDSAQPDDLAPMSDWIDRARARLAAFDALPDLISAVSKE